MMRPNRLHLPASLFAAITAQQGIISAPANLRSLPMEAVRNICQSEGIQRLKCSFHNASDEDDFSVLGPLVGKGESNLRKLMTEKPDLYRPNRNPTKKAFSGSSLPAEGNPELKENIFPDVENQKNVYRSDINNKCSSNIRKPKSICIKNVPSVLSLSQLKQALSAFGNISHASKRTRQNELDCCDVEFESVESSTRAISVGEITVRSYNLAICPLHCQEAVPIRISNISSGTTDPSIHSICKSYGALEGLSRTKVDAVDALFSVENNTETQSILGRLKHTEVNGHKWSAHLHHTVSKPIELINHDVGECSLGLEMSRNLEDRKRQTLLKVVYLEDLEYLHSALMHLEAAHPD